MKFKPHWQNSVVHLLVYKLQYYKQLQENDYLQENSCIYKFSPLLW